MALIEIDRHPSPRTLRIFGVGLGVFLGLVGALLRWQLDAPGAARVLWILAVALVGVYVLVPPLRRFVYVGWCYAFLPVGWLISHVLLGALYYLVITPIGLALRLLGRDPLHRRREERAPSYWVEYDPRSRDDPDRPFRPF